MWVAAQNALTLAVLLLAPLFRGQWHGTATTVVGVGAWFGIAGVRAIGRNLTPYPKPLEDSKLVQHGVYGVVRHPLYTSLVFGMAGWALAWSSGAALAASLVLIVLLDAKARREEQWLFERFPGYAAYAARVRRLLPWIY